MCTQSNAMGLQGLGVGASAFGSYNLATAQKGALNYEASVANNNAALAEYQAQVTAQVGANQQFVSGLKYGQAFGDQRAALAASGVDLGSGSAVEGLATTKYMGKVDQLTIQNNTANQIWAEKTQAQGYTSEAAFDKAGANSINPVLSGATSLLSGAGTVASSWYRYN